MARPSSPTFAEPNFVSSSTWCFHARLCARRRLRSFGKG
jgi:hypothetical protein